MRLHRLRLTNVRGVGEREITFPATGVTVVEGGNEIGKTTMVDALDLLLEEKDSCANAKVRGIKPVTADVGSAVEADLSTGPYRFTYRKQWNRGTGTTLTVDAPSREQLTGTPAHERVRQILAETLDERLWKALRVMQAEPLTQAGLAGSAALASALDAAAGTSGDPAAGDLLVDAVEQEYLGYLTRTGKPTGRYRAAIEALRQAEDDAARADQALAEITRDVERHAALTAELSQLATATAAAEAEHAELSTRWAEVEGLRTRLADRAEAVAVSRRELELATAERETRRALVAEVDERSRAAERLRDQLGTLRPAFDELTRTLAERDAEAAALAAEEAGTRAEAARRRAEADHLRDVAELERLTARLTAITATVAEIERARGVLAASVVDRDFLRTAEEASARLDRALAVRDAAAARLVLEPLAEVDLAVDGQLRHLATGEVTELAVTRPVRLQLPGRRTATIHPRADAHDQSTAVEEARSALDDLLAAAGATSLAQLRELHDRHRDAERDLALAEREHADRLGTDDPAELHRQAEALRERTATYRTRRDDETGGQGQEPADPSSAGEGAEVASARQLSEAAEEVHALARVAATTAAKEAEGLRREHTTLRVELATLGSALGTGEAELTVARDRLALARTLHDDGDLEHRLAEAMAAGDAARDAERELRDLLAAADPDSLQVRLTNAEQVRRRLAEEIESLTAEASGVRARLEVVGGQGRQDEHDRARTALAAARREHDGLRRRAEAVAVLREVMQRHREQARREYVAPFREQVVRLGRIVYGPDFDVEIDAGLTIVTRTLDGTTLRYEALSSGARSARDHHRLACSAVVDEDAGVPVIIDDALGHSDPERLHRSARCSDPSGRGPR